MMAGAGLVQLPVRGPRGQFWLSPALPRGVAGSLMPKEGHASLLSCPISAPGARRPSSPLSTPREEGGLKQSFLGPPGLLETWMRRRRSQQLWSPRRHAKGRQGRKDRKAGLWTLGASLSDWAVGPWKAEFESHMPVHLGPWVW